MLTPDEGIIARLSDLAIAYEVEGEGIPLVFIHQVATDHRLWYHQHAYFTHGIALSPLICWDMGRLSGH